MPQVRIHNFRNLQRSPPIIDRLITELHSQQQSLFVFSIYYLRKINSLDCTSDHLDKNFSKILRIKIRIVG